MPVTISAVLEPDRTPPSGHGGGARWSGLLRGDGWSAQWSDDRPRTGRVTLSGRFASLYDLGNAPMVRGRVTRVAHVHSRYRAVTGSGPAWGPTAQRVLGRDLDAAPRFFDRDVLYRDPAHPSQEVDSPIGVLVELDLDDVPPPEPRARVVAGDVSSHGDVVWVIDRELPVVVRIDGERVATEHLLPAPVEYSWRRVLATPGGAWVIGGVGVFRCVPGAPVRQIAADAVSAGAVSGERLLACRSHGSWTLYHPDGSALPIQGAEGHVSSVAGDHDGFVVAVVTTFSGEQGRTEFCLVRVSPDGVTTAGPICLGDEDEVDMPVLGGDPLSVIAGRTLSRVGADLGVERVCGWDAMRFGGGSAGRVLWTVGHPTDRQGCVGTWIEPGRDADPVPRQFWSLSIVDGATGQTRRSIPVFVSQPSVAVDARGAVWIVGDGLRVSPAGSAAPPEPVDIDALVASHEEVATGSDDEVGQLRDQR